MKFVMVEKSCARELELYVYTTFQGFQVFADFLHTRNIIGIDCFLPLVRCHDHGKAGKAFLNATSGPVRLFWIRCR